MLRFKDALLKMKGLTFHCRIDIEKVVINMAHPKTTSRRVARKASKILRSRRYSRTVRSTAGSALSQKHGRKHRR